jgi:DNA-binding MarR family transcriptional regulator
LTVLSSTCIINIIDNKQEQVMTSNSLWFSAEELLVVMPLMSTLIAVKLRQEIDAEITLIQFRALTQLQEQSITLTELAEQRGVTRQAVSLQVQGLVERGWVQRIPDLNDRRQAMLEVTDEGLIQLQKARQSLTEYMAGLLEALTPDELTTIQNALPIFRRLITKATDARNMPVQEQQE